MEFACAFGLHHHTNYLSQVILLALSGINYLKPFGLSPTKAYVTLVMPLTYGLRHIGHAFNLYTI